MKPIKGRILILDDDVLVAVNYKKTDWRARALTAD